MNVIVWSARAAMNVREIEDYIALDDPIAATRWALRLHDAVDVTRRHSHAGRAVPELSRDDVREIICGRYRIVYVVRPRVIGVLTVFEGHRRLPRDLDPDRDR